MVISPSNSNTLIYWQHLVGIDNQTGVSLWSPYQTRLVDVTGLVSNTSPIPATQLNDAISLSIKARNRSLRVNALWNANGIIFKSESNILPGSTWSLPANLGLGPSAPTLLNSIKEYPFSTRPEIEEQSYVWSTSDTNNAIAARTYHLAAGMSGVTTSLSEIKLLSLENSEVLTNATIDEQSRTTLAWKQIDVSGLEQFILSQLSPGSAWKILETSSPVEDFDLRRDIHLTALPGQAHMLVGYDFSGNVIAKNFHPIIGWGQVEIISETSPQASQRDQLKIAYDNQGNVQVVWLSFTRAPTNTTSRVFSNRFHFIDNSFKWQGNIELSDPQAESLNTNLSIAMANNGHTAVLWQEQSNNAQQLRISEYSNANGWGNTQTLYTALPGEQLHQSKVTINALGNISVSWGKTTTTNNESIIEVNLLRKF